MGSEERKKHKRMKKNNDKNISGEGKEEKSQMITDDRFASAQTDPRFVEPPKRRSKVEIDSRFDRLFTNSSFNSSNAPVDKRGKRKKNKEASATALGHYYSLGLQQNGNEASLIGKRDDDESRAAASDQVVHQTESEKLNETLEDDDDDDDAGDVHNLDESFPTSTTDSDSDSEGQYLDEEEEDTFMQQVRNFSVFFPFLSGSKKS